MFYFAKIENQMFFCTCLCGSGSARQDVAAKTATPAMPARKMTLTMTVMQIRKILLARFVMSTMTIPEKLYRRYPLGTKTEIAPRAIMMTIAALRKARIMTLEIKERMIMMREYPRR